MARLDRDLAELARRIEELPPERRVRLLEHVLTPKLRLRLVLQEIREQVRAPQKKIDRVVNQAVREVRRERARGR